MQATMNSENKCIQNQTTFRLDEGTRDVKDLPKRF